jgi:hypothetical protein
MDQPGIIIPFVEILEDGGEDFGLFVWKGDLLVVRPHELPSAGSLKEGREAENVFVSSKEPLLSPND